MKNMILACSAVLAFAAVGCGDDDNGNPDLAVRDMAMAASDMAKSGCKGIVACTQTPPGCTTASCLGACLARSKGAASSALASALSTCVDVVCGPGDGGTGDCTLPAGADQSPGCGNCKTTVAIPGACAADFAACQADTP